MIYVLKRLLASIPTLLIVSIFVFVLLRLVPGDPAALMIGDTGSSADLDRVRAEMGLNEPLPVQYAIWLGKVVQGDLGTSFMTQEPVLSALLNRFAVTLQVVLIAFVIAAMIAIPAGVLAGRLQNSRIDMAIVFTATLFLSLPSFWVGMLLILVFGTQLGWLPTLGFVPITDSVSEWFAHIIIPVMSLVCVEMAILTRLVRASTIEVMRQDYVTYARAKGVSETRIVLQHILKNALSPTVTMLGLILGSLLSGTAVIETIFGLPGLGRFLVDAIYARDYPVIQGTLLFIVVIYTLVNLAVDLIYPLLDPRVRRS